METVTDTPTTENPWRETVRDIYDKLHFETPGFFSSDPLAKQLIAFIEDRHPAYFVEPHPMPQAKKP